MASLAARIPAIGRNPRFLALWTAQSVSTLGDALTTLTLVLLITERTHSVAAVGGLTIALAVPAIVIGLLSGSFVDRWDRRRVMIASDLARAILLAALAFAGPALVTIYLIAFLQAAVGTFFNPARAALMQVIVPADDQVRANSLIQTTTVVGELAGTTLAGVLVGVWHTYWLSFAIDAATFACSAALILTIRRTEPEPDAEHPSTFAAIAEGLRAVRTSPTLRALLLVFSALTFALSPMAVLLTPYVVDTLHISTSWIGPVQAGDTVGTILGGAVLAVLAKRGKPRALILTGMAVLAVLLATIAVATTVVELLAVYFVFGLLTVAVQTGIGALTQTSVDNALMGRFIGLMSIVPGLVSVLSMAFAGTAGAAFGVRTIFVTSGVILAATTFLSWRQFRGAQLRNAGLRR
ncbi:MFS transporter [Amycolatopsis sp. CA-230715]|uniref:MFS transporter n=1 Tax=Amycolatopsis sp. CA-230715 TaxID=2745196 RepID=UPI001C020229|nr:MFS transporter [Amycolatopsis sp. CA-230715]QWF82337.1 Enterobactin exporter EntS [Amycolatopsis sp. CA-230715]